MSKEKASGEKAIKPDGQTAAADGEAAAKPKSQPPPTSSRPAFSAPLYAWMRQGLKECTQLLQAFPDSIHPIEEPGTLGNPTQAMVTEQIGSFSGYNAMLEGYAGRGKGKEAVQDRNAPAQEQKDAQGREM